MPTDPRRLRASELCRLVNSTPLGEVLNERQLHRHRSRAGMRIGDGRHIDLLRYTAWLVEVRHTPKPQPEGDPYAKAKERARARNVALAIAGRDIGQIPDVVNPDHRRKAAADFRYFCELYFPLTFHLPWSPDHLKVIAKIEQAVLRGGLFAMAMPRGSGKALALDTPLPTPWGWTTMGRVEVGDLLFDDEGWPCRVVATTEVQHDRPCYEVRFSDGEAITCDAEHLWTVEDRWRRGNPLTLNVETIKDRIALPTQRQQPERRYRVKVASPLNLPAAELDVDPYVLGYWLGDGTASTNTITVHVDDLDEVATEIRRSGESCDVRFRARQVAVCALGKGHRANPAKARRLQTALAGLACHVPPRRVAQWAGLTEKTVSAMRSLGR